jgi:protease I
MGSCAATRRARRPRKPAQALCTACRRRRSSNMSKLSGRKVAILVAKGFEQVELTEPRRVLEHAGATIEIVSPEDGTVRGWDHTDWGEEIPVDRSLSDARAEDYDALLLPGGVMNPDHLRKNEDAVRFTRAFFEAHKPVAAICHAPWLLVEADVVRDREVTSYESLKTDLRNAGAKWVDREVVVDNGLVTSRNPDDLPAFNRKMLEEFAEGVHEGQRPR